MLVKYVKWRTEHLGDGTDILNADLEFAREFGNLRLTAFRDLIVHHGQDVRKRIDKLLQELI